MSPDDGRSWLCKWCGRTRTGKCNDDFRCWCGTLFSTRNTPGLTGRIVVAAIASSSCLCSSAISLSNDSYSNCDVVFCDDDVDVESDVPRGSVVLLLPDVMGSGDRFRNPRQNLFISFLRSVQTYHTDVLVKAQSKWNSTMVSTISWFKCAIKRITEKVQQHSLE